MNVQCHNVNKIKSKINETSELEAQGTYFSSQPKVFDLCSQCKKETTYNQVANKRKLIDPGLQQVYCETGWGRRIQ